MITITDRRIRLDGTPALVLAGEIHYFRTARTDWADRVDKLVEIGCDCVASYIPWLFHELPDGTLDLTGRTAPERDLGAFIDLCADKGLTFFARPGPFVMAELKNEGLPYRLYRDHPEVIGVGWDGAPATTRTVDYLAPAYLAEVDRWYGAVMPLLAQRAQPRGGNVIGVQLDNEVGMLAWVSNSPDLTGAALVDLLSWAQDRYGDELPDRFPVDLDDPAVWAAAVRSPAEEWAGALRVDLGLFFRDRFARYFGELATMARRHGVTDLPFSVNIHGTEGGNGVPFGIGVSQLLPSYAGIQGFFAGSDHYLGDMSLDTTIDIHFINALMAATNGPDQPLTSLEFEAGTGDYSGGLDLLYDASTTELKTRLCVGQGNRMINYYLLAGGVNPHLDSPVGDGNDRISFTGELHGTAAPIGPHGERGMSFEATRRSCAAIRANAEWLADMDEELDDLAIGLWPDAFMTEYHHPGSAIMTDLVDDLATFRGAGQRKSLWKSLLLAGYRFSAVNLQTPELRLPTVLAVSCGSVLDTDVQVRLVSHVESGGGLLLTGLVPTRDIGGRPCRILGDALGVEVGATVRGDQSCYPSVTGRGVADVIAETRVGWFAELRARTADPLLEDVAGRPCGVAVRVGAGRAVIITAELPTIPTLFTALARWLGSSAGLGLRSTVPGVVAT
ncbi:MAG: beta-galactosidase, partial [Propionibacteriaceae bacterium]